MSKTRKLKFWTSVFLIFCCVGLAFGKCWADKNFTAIETSMAYLSPSMRKVVYSATDQIGKTLIYDPTYRKLDYPNGDVPISRGVCTDVVVRALRAIDFDLQEKVHLDMKTNFASYPKNWGLTQPDPNIDHRRVPNLNVYFQRIGWSLPVTSNKKDYRAGDIISWKLNNGRDHIGILSNKVNFNGVPLAVHNIGFGAQEENILFSWKITGHFRPQIKKSSSTDEPSTKMAK